MSASGEPAGGAPVLIADDDAASLAVAETMLRAAGFEVCAVGNGDEAVREFARRGPALVLLDVHGPGLDAFGVCRGIRAHPTSHDVPVVMVAGREDTESVQQAFACGATDIITGPLSWATLPHRLHHILRASAAARGVAAGEERFRTMLGALPDMIWLVDDQGRIAEDFGGGSDPAMHRSVAGRRLEEVLPPEGARAFRDCLQIVLGTRATQTCEHALQGRAGLFESRFVHHSGHAVLTVVRDITERKRAEARIHRLAYFDDLTSLPNRQQLVREMRRAIRAAHRSGGGLAVLYLDLDQFKRINDTLGHNVGDALLKAVGTRLEGCMRPADYVARLQAPHDRDVTIARLGGDEFVVVVADVGGREVVDRVAERIRLALREPFQYQTHELVVTPSIGIAMYPEHGRTIEQLLMNADAAMYRAKAAGRDTYHYYSDTMYTRSLERLDLEGALRAALEGNSLALHYQPKVCLRTRRIVGAEALLRWQHPERGWIPPSRFIPIAEETGLIAPLGDWVIDTACRQLRRWADAGLEDLHVAVNVSGRQFSTGSFADELMRRVRDAGVAAQSLELEITESLILQDAETNIATLERLRGAGFKLAVDDFGTGYSSLSYLKRFPVGTLKIDRSFVRDLHVDRDDAAICAAILAMAHSLGLQVVAEGVELEEQLAFLREHGCDLVQGFLFGRPEPAEEFFRRVACAVETATTSVL